MVQKFSHGRGGAGNIAAETVKYVDGLTYSPPILSVLSPLPSFSKDNSTNCCVYSQRTHPITPLDEVEQEISANTMPWKSVVRRTFPRVLNVYHTLPPPVEEEQATSKQPRNVTPSDEKV